MNLLPVLTNRRPSAEQAGNYSGYTWVYDTIPLQLEMVWVAPVHSFHRDWGKPGPVFVLHTHPRGWRIG